MHGHDRGAGARERERVLKVRERWAQAAQDTGEGGGHPPDLAAGGELDCLDPLRNEVGAAGDRGEAEVVHPQLAQEPAHVGLVTGALSAEDVRVDHDKRHAHAAASR